MIAPLSPPPGPGPSYAVSPMPTQPTAPAHHELDMSRERPMARRAKASSGGRDVLIGLVSGSLVVGVIVLILYLMT